MNISLDSSVRPAPLQSGIMAYFWCAWGGSKEICARPEKAEDGARPDVRSGCLID